jgi:hypothetical protein
MATNQLFVRLACAALAASVAAGGCSSPPEAPRGNDQIRPTYNEKTGRLEKITYDRNRDGKVDAWTFMNGTRVVRAELDDNHDGQVDRWEFYDTADTGGASPSGAPAAGVLVRVESSTRNDGTVSRREYYERGQRARAEEDTDGDGKVDKWETWADRALSTILLDTDGDGRADRRLTYPADGSGPRFEVATADGTFAAAP